jgi:hypothetical protein
MSVFDANTVTATAPLSGSDATIDSLLLGQGQANGIATDNFLQAVTNMQPGNEQLQTEGGDVSEFIDGKVNLAINSDFIDFVYGSLYSITMEPAPVW